MPYFLLGGGSLLREFVQHIHLNSLQADLVSDTKALVNHPWSGYSCVRDRYHQITKREKKGTTKNEKGKRGTPLKN